MASRAFDPLQPGLLVHPTFGTLAISIVAATAHKLSNLFVQLSGNPYANDEGAHTGAVGLHGGGLYGGDQGPDV